MEERIRSLLPSSVQVTQEPWGSLRPIACGDKWNLVFDPDNQVMLLSYDRKVTEWTSMSLLNLHLRLVLLPDSNRRFLLKAKTKHGHEGFRFAPA